MAAVSLSTLEEAFALAHKASENPEIPATDQALFRAIAHLIWKACGSQKGGQWQR
jgi:hypothetical protein